MIGAEAPPAQLHRRDYAEMGARKAAVGLTMRREGGIFGGTN